MSCQNESKKISPIVKVDPNNVDSVIVVSPPINVEIESALNPYIGLTALKNGLIIIPFSSYGLDTLSFIMNHDIATCCIELKPLLKKGRGPGEATVINGASKSFDGNSLILFSSNETKFLIYDVDFSLDREKIMFEPLSIRGSFIEFGKDFIVPQSASFNNGNLFKIINLDKEESYSKLKAKVPVGFEPQIRNQVRTIARVPNGFVFSLAGDQEIRFSDESFQINRVLKLGENDPFEIWKANPEKDGAFSNIYIRKVEYDGGNLFILYKKRILVFSYPDLTLLKSLSIYKDVNINSLEVIDFSIYEDQLYVSYSGKSISKVKLIPDWRK